MTRTYQATGALTVALLALTACGDAEEEPSEPSEPAETGQQDPTPDEDPEGETGTETGAEGEAGDPPALTEINDQIWSASAEQESVQLHIAVPASLMNEENGTQEAPEGTDAEGMADTDDAAGEAGTDGETVEVDISGSVAGDGTRYEHSQLGEFLVLEEGDLYLQPVDGFIAEYQASAEQQNVEIQVPAEELRQALEAEGEWIEVSTTHADAVETPEEFLENFRSSLDEEIGGDVLGGVEAQAQAESRNGEPVWVFTTGDTELVVAADREQPLLSSVSTAESGISVEFSGWNETDGPEVPGEDEIIFESDLGDVVEPLVQQ